MKKSLAILTVLCLFASVSVGAELLVTRYPVDRDNFKDTSTPMYNYGRKCNARWAKDKQEVTHYADWTEDQLLDLEAALAQPLPPGDYTAWEVRYAFTGVSWEGPNPASVIWFGAFSSATDWVNDEAPDNTGPNLDVGACDAYADSVPVPEVNWIDPVSGLAVSFWGLPELTNSVPFVGFVPTVPVNFGNMAVVVDPPVLAALIGDPNVRGLRCWSDLWNNHQVYARGQWGDPGAAAALELWAIPEPATMLLRGLGGVGLVLRKRR